MTQVKIIDKNIQFSVSADGPMLGQKITLVFNSNNSFSAHWTATLETPMSPSSDYYDATLGGLVRKTGGAPVVHTVVKSLANRKQTKAFAKFIRDYCN